MKTLLLLFLSSIALADIPKDEDLLAANWKKKECRAVGKLLMKGPVKGTNIGECTAFLTSRNTITTAGHCLKFGIKNVRFCLHYTGTETPKCSLESELEGPWTSGGGLKNLEELKGWDWGHATLKEPLGDQLVKGVKVGWLDLSNSSDELVDGSEVTVVSYLGDWYEGEHASFQRSKLYRPPKFMLKGNCDFTPENAPEDKQEVECNFMHLRDYRYSTNGTDSGAPVIGKSGKVIGIMVARSTKGNEGWPWAATVNESKLPAAWAMLHLEQLKFYHRIFDLVAALKGRTLVFPKDDANAWDRVKQFQEVVTKFEADKTFPVRFERIQKLDTAEGLEYLSTVIDEARTRNRAQPNGDGIFMSIPESSVKVQDGTKRFAQFYNSSVPASEDSYVADRDKDAKTREEEILELKRKRKELEKDIKGGMEIPPIK